MEVQFQTVDNTKPSYPIYKTNVGNFGADKIDSSLFDDFIKTEDEKELELKNEGFNVIAHRGFDKDAPENTLSAFQAAVDNGYKTIELDIAWSKDGVPVVLHDKTINRTARKPDGSRLILPKKCSDLTYQELLGYDFGILKGEDYKGEKIPTFEQVADFAKENNVNLYIELKETDNLSDDKIQLLVKTLSDRGLLDNVTWISFNADYLKQVSNISPNSRLGYLSKKSISKKTIETLKSIKTDTNEVFLDVKASKVKQKGVDLLNESGFNFEAWGVDDTETAQNLKNFGCSAITTDTLV